MFKIFINTLLVLSMMNISLSWGKEDAEGARDAVVSMVDSFRTDIVNDKELLADNPQLLGERVNAILEKIINFDTFSKKVMGKYYRRANPEQRKRFATVTKDTLLKTYGNSLLDLDADRIKVLPLGPQGKGKDTKVNVDFQTSSSGLLNIAFHMQYAKSGRWMLNNIVINNINFGLTFRKQFAVMMAQNKNNIDLAIDAWRNSLARKI